MAKLNIVKLGDPILRKKSKPIEKIDDRIKELAADMLETMRAAEGVGLAAVQVGKLRRIVVVETEPGKPYILINPEIVEFSGSSRDTEGCLSLPNRWGITERPTKVTVKAMGLDGKEFTVTGTDLTARAFCHEIDHLEGTLFIDKMIEEVDPKDLK